jgi:aspartyl-tRNA(Asn)/glutamyl-tRNA(Gln) amidotransferase subunit B
MKNVNSFNGAAHAIEYEVKRQIEVISAGGTIVQETRRWDDDKGMSFTMRSKEDAQDYRYFPEPDLRTLVLEPEYLEQLRASIPELPNKKLLRYMKNYGLTEFDAGLLAQTEEKAVFFEECTAIGGVQPKNVANWLSGDVAYLLSEKNLSLTESKLTAKKLVGLAALIEKGAISNTAGKTVLEELLVTGAEPETIVKEKGLLQLSDTAALEAIVADILAANEKSVADYKGGKTNALGFLVGQCMRASKGKGNPQILKELLLKAIERA